jgi:signal peptidase II
MNSRPKGRGPALGLAALVLVVGYALDQFTKYLVETRMDLYESIDVIPGVLRWYSIRNSGAAFSLGEGYTVVFTIFMALVAVVVAAVLLPRVRGRAWGLALGGLLAGTLGNLTDRLFRPPAFGHGHVVDFVSVGNFAIFNVADACIVVSMIGIVILLWFGFPLSGEPRKTDEPTPEAADEAADGADTPSGTAS